MIYTGEDYSPIFAGDTSNPFAPQFQTTDENGNTIPQPLTGMTISMKMGGPNGEAGPDGVTITCGDYWTVDDAANGLAHYQWQTSDVSTPGDWTLYVTLTDSNGRPVHADTKVLRILAAI